MKTGKELVEFEDIYAGLKTLGEYRDGADENKVLIVETLQKLPKQVREKVVKDVAFVILGDLGGLTQSLHFTYTVPKEELKDRNGRCYSFYVSKPLIALNMSSNMPLEKRKDVIAHEIAHFILGHHLDCNSTLEREADNLSQKWGFRRCYKSYGGG